jgi:TRAP-type mannitol/chloroaromatic compound transport system permease small subunit
MPMNNAARSGEAAGVPLPADSLQRPQPALILVLPRKEGRVRRLLDGLYLAAGGIGAFFVVLICVFMIGQSVLREVGVSTAAVNDCVSWFCAAAGFFTMAHALKHGDFVRVSLLLDHLGAKTRHGFELVSLAIASVAVTYLAFWACKFTYESWKFHEMSQGLLAIPIWIPQTSFAAGSLLLVIAVVDELVIVVRGGVPTYVRAVQERHAQGDFSSEV